MRLFLQSRGEDPLQGVCMQNLTLFSSSFEIQLFDITDESIDIDKKGLSRKMA
jgi:hypothetical protein